MQWIELSQEAQAWATLAVVVAMFVVFLLDA